MKTIKNAIRNWCLNNLFSLISLNDILLYNDKSRKVFINNQEVFPDALKAMQEEIKWLAQTSIWKVLNDTLESQAKQLIFEKSKTQEDLTAGKSMLYTLDLQKKILNIIINAS